MAKLVYHLLPLKYALSDIANKRLKVATYDDLNDPFELLAPDMRQRESRLLMQELKANFQTSYGLLCFSSKYNDPVLWSHYGDRHKGVALGFEIENPSLGKVTYTSQRIETPTVFPPSQAIMEQLIHTKYKGWSYEKEIRKSVLLEDMNKENKHYFYQFDNKVVLKEVILGPLCHFSRRETEALLNQQSYTGVRVWKARLAWRKFGVVENKFASGRITVEARRNVNA